MDIRRSPDPQALAIDAAVYIAGRISDSIAESGSCHLALAGGRTPEATYKCLRDMTIDWQRLHIWFGDERCLPSGDEERNDTMARTALLDHVPIPKEQIHTIAAELGATAAASAYCEDLRLAPPLDLILLGLGEDGHTASIFPGHGPFPAGVEAVAIFDAPKPPPERVSLSPAYIRQASERIVLASGSSKQDALKQIQAGKPLPAAKIGEAIWLVDEAAISG
ncbi:MAG TPA: 6-phosphogluconolactonase [Mariprofundaceae bacterium]|nr:6-phosphogluconolactonase [Mariprofundaceae bacterium]